jgi:hypothetical protein
MANKQKLQDLLKQRTALPQREAVSPVNLYTNPQVDKTTESNKSIQVDKTTKLQTVKTVKPQVNKPVKPLVVKYTTHLQPSQIKAIKRLALDTDKKDYEVVGEAIETHLLKLKKT